jgi:hypothetical protein
VAATQKEQLLMLAMAASIAEGRKGDVEALEQKYGREIPPTMHWGPLRSFLLAWE